MTVKKGKPLCAGWNTPAHKTSKPIWQMLTTRGELWLCPRCSTRCHREYAYIERTPLNSGYSFNNKT